MLESYGSKIIFASQLVKNMNRMKSMMSWSHAFWRYVYREVTLNTDSWQRKNFFWTKHYLVSGGPASFYWHCEIKWGNIFTKKSFWITQNCLSVSSVELLYLLAWTCGLQFSEGYRWIFQLHARYLHYCRSTKIRKGCDNVHNFYTCKGHQS